MFNLLSGFLDHPYMQKKTDMPQDVLALARMLQV